MNRHAVSAMYFHELRRMRRTLTQSLIAPVVTTTLYFIVFGAIVGARVPMVAGVSYGAFIVPGLLMMALMSQSLSHGSFSIFFPRFTGTVYELLSAPVSPYEILLGFVGAAATKAVLVGGVILLTARCFVPLQIQHPVWMLVFSLLAVLAFGLVGFLIGLWADSFEKLQMAPQLVLTPLTFLGGSFYALEMLPQAWQQLALFNPLVYLISGLRWSFYGQGDVHLWTSLAVALGCVAAATATVAWTFHTGYKLKA